jgi:RHS repeat-associated protein
MNSTTTKEMFTSYERDPETGNGTAGTGNDYAMARYNVNRLGRFSSIDPLSGSLGNPQSLNHYAYVTNDPVNGSDPTGMSDLTAICGGGPASGYVDQTCGGENGNVNGGGGSGGVINFGCLFSCLNSNGDAFFYGGQWTPDNASMPFGDCPQKTICVTFSYLDTSPFDMTALSQMIPRQIPGQDFGDLVDGGGGGGPASKGSFNSCMVRNAKNFSIGGVVDAATFQHTNLKSGWTSLFFGNMCTDIYSSFAGGGPPDASSLVPLEVADKSVGKTLQSGRAAEITTLNLIGKSGPNPFALGGKTPSAFKSALGIVGDILNLGMDATTRAAVDAALLNAEAVYCALNN